MTSLKALTTNCREVIPYPLDFIQPQCFTFLQSKPTNAVIAQIERQPRRVPQHSVRTSGRLTPKVAVMLMLAEVHERLLSVIHTND